MRYYHHSPTVSFSGGIIPRGVKCLLIANTIIFIIYFLSVQIRITPLLLLFHGLSLIPSWVIKGAVIWQPVTYLFLHSPLGFSHILFNMLSLWWFGSDLERDWGTKRFLNYYFFCGVGAGLCDVAVRLLLGNERDLITPTIGASGAIYGLLLAFGILYPNRTILLYFLFPIPARIFVLILGGITFLSTFGAAGSGISHMAHLGGMIFGFYYLTFRPRLLDIDLMSSLKSWRLRRARHRFEVHMRKQDQDGPDDWVN
jgi:membrane associated rhomboid family serine protease